MSHSPIRCKHFLIEYQRSTGMLWMCREFENSDYSAAAKLRFERECANTGNSDIDVVLLGAPSLEVLKFTHGRYFYTFEQLLQQLLDEMHRRGIDTPGF